MILQNIEHYYRFHARIYDATRWSFLFGRTELIQQVVNHFVPSYILEIGCGTGKNLANLAHYSPQARLVGLDISEDMLRQAHKNLTAYSSRVKLLHRTYDRPITADPAYDLILFSYSLSMMHKDWQNVIECAQQNLKSGRLTVASKK